MTKTGQDFAMWAGNHVDLVITVTDSTGASKDMTGASAVWAMAENELSGSLIRKTSDAASDIALGGCTMTVYLVPSETCALYGVYHFEAQVRDSASKVSTVTTGLVRINRRVIE